MEGCAGKRRGEGAFWTPPNQILASERFPGTAEIIMCACDTWSTIPLALPGSSLPASTLKDLNFKTSTKYSNSLFQNLREERWQKCADNFPTFPCGVFLAYWNFFPPVLRSQKYFCSSKQKKIQILREKIWENFIKKFSKLAVLFISTGIFKIILARYVLMKVDMVTPTLQAGKRSHIQTNPSIGLLPLWGIFFFIAESHN